MSYRKMEYLHRNKIVYRRYPISDHPTQTYNWGWYYEEGTHQYYSLFNSKAKINTMKSFIWHARVLYYLNDLTEKEFINLISYIADAANGYTTFNISDSNIASISSEIINSRSTAAPKNKLRKVVFKDGIGLDVSEKLKITGKLIGRNKNASASDIYEIMLYLHDKGEKITIKKISNALNVTTRTIYRNITDELKKEKDQLNEELQS
jgi:hypothetical protein